MNKYLEKLAATYHTIDSKSNKVVHSQKVPYGSTGGSALTSPKPRKELSKKFGLAGKKVINKGLSKNTKLGLSVAAGAAAGTAIKKLREKKAAMSQENKQVLRTALESSAVGLPAGIAGARLGHLVGKRYGKASVGTFVGSHVLGGGAELVALKRGFNSHSKTLTKDKK